MSMIENLFLYPVRLLMKMLWLLIPLFLVACILLLMVKFPYNVLGFSIGFLVASRILCKLGIYNSDATNSLSILVMKYRELSQMQELYHMRMDSTVKKNDKKAQRLQNKIQKLKKETNQLEKKYTEILDRKPDRILYIPPRSFLQLIKNRLFYLGR